YRSVGTVSFLGRYAIIDFVLSNLSNSGIDNVGILIQEKPRSLFEYLGNDSTWNFNTKAGGISLLYNEKYNYHGKYNHDIHNLIENIEFLKTTSSDYVIMAPAHIITTMDYSKVIEQHEKTGAQVTMVYTPVTNANDAYYGEQVLTIKQDMVTNLKPNKGAKNTANISLETYVFNTKTLLQVVRYASKISGFFTMKDVLAYVCDEKQIRAYKYTGYARCIDSIKAYYEYSLELLDMDLYAKVFNSRWPIYAVTNDTPPTKYLKHAVVKKSVLANGAIINGTVENSIIGREVIIGKDAYVKNCIILAGAKIAPNAHLENVIVETNARIEKKIELSGDYNQPLYINEGDIV
ncbi:MAG: glucose-1-phosphate adenylyltransferase subunit GlgD, partial [Coprobacillaceae bacterium]